MVRKITKFRFSMTNVPLYLFFILYLMFTIADLQTSAQTGNAGANRLTTHLILIAFSLYLFIFLAINIRKITLVQPLISLCLMFFWIFICNAINKIAMWSNIVQLNMSALWIMVYLFFEMYSQQKNIAINLQKILLFFLCFYSIATVYFFIKMYVSLNRIPVLNLIYYAVSIIPWLRLQNEKIKKIYFAFFIFVLVSMKRGAIIAFPVMWLIDSYVTNKIMNRKKSINKILKYIIALVIIAGVLLLADHLSNGFLSQRFTLEELSTGSGRTDLYSIAINEISNRNFVKLLIGSGSASSVALLGTGVHNEWLEMLFSYGLIGLFLYVTLIFGLLYRLKRIKTRFKEYLPASLMMFVLYILLSIFSTGYGGYTGIFLFGFWGYVNGLMRNEEVHCER